jgi:hypothetical protein
MFEGEFAAIKAAVLSAISLVFALSVNSAIQRLLDTVLPLEDDDVSDVGKTLWAWVPPMLILVPMVYLSKHWGKMQTVFAITQKATYKDLEKQGIDPKDYGFTLADEKKCPDKNTSVSTPAVVDP